MSAQLLFRDKYIYAAGAIREMEIRKHPMTLRPLNI